MSFATTIPWPLGTLVLAVAAITFAVGSAGCSDDPDRDPGGTGAAGTGGSWYPTYPQISNHDDTPIEVIDSVIE
jgi:hypothetical protein